MADFFDSLSDKLADFIAEQPMFFVATAPRSGRINLSPKGMDCLRVLGPNRVAYLDMTGSGAETAAHLRDDGRMTIMLCSFTRNPLILRLYGTGSSIMPGTADWDGLIDRFEMLPGARQIVSMDITSVQTSCGFAVPEMDFVGHRQTLAKWTEKKADALPAYQRDNNTVSIDGIPTGFFSDAAE